MVHLIAFCGGSKCKISIVRINKIGCLELSHSVAVPEGPADTRRFGGKATPMFDVGRKRISSVSRGTIIN